MSVPLAYLAIVLIWATTPLAIQWSTQGIGFALAVLLRMLIGVVVAGLIIALWRIRFPLHERARRAYLVGGLALFGGMALTYWGARYIHSGLISVLFGLSPLAAAILGAVFVGERSLTRVKLIGMLLGAGGLATIFVHGDSLGHEHALAGLFAVLCAVTIYSGGMVWLKQIGDDSPPLATTVGSLSVSLPLFALVWWSTDGQLPAIVPPRAGAAVAYLGVFGSVIGFALYYYVIKHLETAKVALITLITPVLALLLGSWLNGESIGLRLWLGTALILLGLSVHQWEMLAGLRRRV
ncbi:DMT family transporter [Dechloromonas sp. XY25]|uniref:DMT family transporter n=1 Tax=Dechloromonas hankyongensis TaxID=2908002 RepID=A0ABS9JXN6_9RHOO|nr:DMT family transporter [Dechloromonas hankyongensis]MCG2575666.1 DMT family transporter [Dechloromonas hankyongensis]